MKVSKYLVGFSLALVVLFPLVASKPVLAADEKEMMTTQKISGWNMAHVTWMTTPDAAYYNLYFKMAGAKMWQHSVRMLPKTSDAVDIKFLTKGKKYVYMVSAAKPNGVEFWWSKEMTMKTTMMK